MRGLRRPAPLHRWRHSCEVAHAHRLRVLGSSERDSHLEAGQSFMSLSARSCPASSGPWHRRSRRDRMCRRGMCERVAEDICSRSPAHPTSSSLPSRGGRVSLEMSHAASDAVSCITLRLADHLRGSSGSIVTLAEMAVGLQGALAKGTRSSARVTCPMMSLRLLLHGGIPRTWCDSSQLGLLASQALWGMGKWRATRTDERLARVGVAAMAIAARGPKTSEFAQTIVCVICAAVQEGRM